MNFDFLEQNYTELFYDKEVTFPQIVFDKKNIRFDQFFSRPQLLLEKIKKFSLPQKLEDIITFDQRNVEFANQTLIQYPNLISYYREKEPSFNENQKLLSIAFITSYVLSLNLFDNFSNDIDILFHPYVFPIDPIKSDRFNYTQNIDFFLFHYIYSVDDTKALDLYTSIYHYWISTNPQTILNFMPLLIQLLYQWKSINFFSSFKQSFLFLKILKAAQDDYFLFYFVKNCIQIYPDEFFQSKNGLSMISFYFFNPDLRPETASLLDKGLKVADQNPQMQKEIFLVISNIITSFVGKDDPEAIVILFDMVTNCFPELQLSLVQDAFQTSIFDQMAKIAISSLQYFNKFIFFLTKMGTEYYDFIEFYSMRKSIHNILNQFKCKKLPLFELFKFAFCSSVTKNYSHQYIRNWTAINLLLNIFIINESSCQSQEEEIVQSLLKLSQNKGNLIELNRAKVPEFILKRFPKIQNNEDMRKKYLLLFSTITSSIYNNTTFYRTIELLKNPDFKYPNEILYKLNENLTLLLNQLNAPNAMNNKISRSIPETFFRFDNPKGCGIFGPTVKISGTFSIYFSIRLNDIVSHISFPLLFFDFGRSNICFEFEENYLYFSESRKQERHKFSFEFRQGRWYYLVITSQQNITFQHVSLYVNNNKESEIKVSSNFLNRLNTECTISVCSTSSDPRSWSLLCDLSRLYIINGIDPNLDFTKILTNFSDSLVCNYDPSNAHEGKCFNVTLNNSSKSVPYKGRVIPIISNLESVIQTVGAVKNFFPLFDRASIKPLYENIKINPDQGSKYLQCLISICSGMVSLSEANFTEYGFFELFASFINDCDPKFITHQVINQLFLLFYSLQKDELRAKMVKYVFLNFDISSRLEDNSYLVSVLLSLFIFDGHQYSYEFDINELVYKTILYFNEKSNTSENAWIFLKNVLLSSTSFQTNIQSLLLNMSKFKSNYATEKLLDIIYVLISENTVGCFERFSYYSPFIPTITECSTNIQIDSLKCILKMSKYANFPLDQAISQVITVLQKNDDDFDSFTEHVESFFINDDSSKLNPYLLPLLVHSVSLSSDNHKITLVETIREILISNPEIAESIFDLPLWFSSLMTLVEYVFDPNEDVDKFSTLFTSLFIFELINGLTNDIDKFFDYLSIRSFEKDKCYNKLKSQILVEIFKSDIASNPELILPIFPIAFEFALFSVGVVSNSPDVKISFQVNSQLTFQKDEFFKPSALFVDLSTNLNDTIKILDVVEVHIILVAAFVAVYIYDSKSKEYVEFLHEVTKHFSKYDEQTRKSWNLIITHSFCQTNDFDMIKNTWFSSIFENYEEVLRTKEKKVNLIQEELNKQKVDFIGLDETHSIDKRLLSVSDPNFFTFNYADNEYYLNLQQTKHEIGQKMLIRLKKSFMQDISKVPGPWHIQNQSLKFKALNRISKRGQRVLMVPNNRFNDHREASINRDKKKDEDLPNNNFYYKQIKQMPFLTETKVFTSEVTIRSLSKQTTGTLIVTDKMIQFFSEVKYFSVDWTKVEFILNRRVENNERASEIFTISGRSYFINFPEGERKRFYSYISKLNLPLRISKYGDHFDFFLALRQYCKSIYQNKKSPDIVQNIHLTTLWKNREITTFSYIYYLNMLSGRSYNDSKQYPIYPLLIRNCDSESFDFNDQDSYRDLSKPTAFICQRQKEVPEGHPSYQQLPSNEFLVIWGMVRVEPFTTYQIEFQKKKFLESSRQFYSIKGLWKNMTESIITNESIPEFFTFPYLYLNENRFDLGVRDVDKVRVDDVILPNWAGNAYIYISTNRIALEDDVASKGIHKWIDLFFGVKRRFYDDKKLYPDCSYPELFEKMKKYFSKSDDFSIQKNCDVEIMDEEIYRSKTEEFGTMPAQLFFTEHEERGEITKPVILAPPKISGFKTNEPVIMIMKNIVICESLVKAFDVNGFNSKDEAITEISLPIGCGELLCVSRTSGLLLFGTKIDPFLTVFNLNTKKVYTGFHQHSIITSAKIVGSRYLITGGSDCSLSVWDLATDCNYPISSSGYHADYITSIGCCYENGLLVSADNSSTLVFETLIDHSFITSVSLETFKNCKNQQRRKSLFTPPSNEEINSIISDASNDNNNNNDSNSNNDNDNTNSDDAENDEECENVNESTFIPQICVFRSGIVCVSQKHKIIWFDSHGKVISTHKLEGDFVEMHKYYDYDTREFLIVGSLPRNIDIIDVTTFRMFARINAYRSHFYPIKNTRSILVSTLSELQVYSFGNFIPPVITKYRLNESPSFANLRENEAQ
ncbi:hypothetical protein M9Y10_029364 [Tritrichomonas musculus]|uniref:BEACH domain-containing protein n=1 Tax=Tritrichomonas musculus TaxID=1915356 RepID=A0ABR2KMU0_9EUKA